MKLTKTMILLFIFLLALSAGGATFLLNPHIVDDVLSFSERKEVIAVKTLHFAVSGPMEEESQAGNTFLKAAQVYVDQFNRQAQETGLMIELHPFDDKNKSKEVAAVAEKIVADPKILAVLGHNFSSVSIAAGAVYQKNEIVAITPTSTNVDVTRDNQWSFRTVFDDAYQGRFIAQYSKSMLSKDQVAVYHEDKAYGQFLGEKFLEQARLLGMEVVTVKEYSTDPAEFQSP